MESQTIGLREVDYIPVTDSGMGSSVRVAAVRVYPVSPMVQCTADVIEVSICCDENTMNEGTPVELIEMYVQ